MSNTVTANTLSKAILAFLPAAVWMGCIYSFSAQSILPGLTVNVWDFIFKKTAHMVAFGLLYFLLFLGFRKTVPLTGQTAWSVPLALTILYACLDELHQSFVPGRFGTLRDIGFDTLGCSLVMMRKFGYI